MNTSQKGWAKDITDRLAGKLKLAAEACFANGARLLDDARLLLREDRFQSAAALAILATEEFSKAVILYQAAFQGRWDSALHGALRSHDLKQGVAAGFGLIVQMMESTAPQELVELLQSGDDLLGRMKAISQPAIEAALQVQKTKNIDRVKQSALYVSVDPDANVSSSPCRAVNQEVAESMVLMAECAKRVVQHHQDDKMFVWAQEQVRKTGILPTGA